MREASGSAEPRGGVPRGAWGEAAAAAAATAAGARVLARNVRCRFGEVDLVLDDAGVLVFGEVKARRNHRLGGGREAVSRTKRTRLVRTALHWVVARGLDPARVALRFDVFEVAPGPRVTWLRGAFDAEDAAGGQG